MSVERHGAGTECPPPPVSPRPVFHIMNGFRPGLSKVENEIIFSTDLLWLLGILECD